MSDLGKLVISVSANIAEFHAAMDKAATVSAQRMSNIADNAKKAGAVLAGVMTTGALAFSVALKSTINHLDELDERSQRLGLTTEALSELGYAAKFAGLEAETLDAGIVKLTKSMAEGNPAFEAMGINIKDANGHLKTADEVLRAVAEKFAGYRDGAEKSALAMNIFGKSGAQMITMLNQGRDGINAFAQEAREMGLVVGTEAAQAAGQLNDTLDRITKAGEGATTQVAVGMLPVFQELALQFEDTANDAELLDKIATGLAVTLKSLMTVGSSLSGVFQEATNAIGTAGAVLYKVGEGISEHSFSEIWGMDLEKLKGVVSTKSGEISDIWQQGAQKAGEAASASAQNIQNTWSATSEILKKTQISPGGGGEGVAPVLKSAEEQARKAEAAIKAAAAAQKQLMGEGEKVFDQTRTPLEKLNIELERLNNLQKQGAIDWDTFNRAVSQTQWEFDKAQEAFNKTRDGGKDSFKELQQAVEGWGRASSEAFVDFAFGAKGSFGDMVTSILKDLARMAVYKSVFQPLFGAIGGSEWFSGLGDSLGFGGPRASGGPVKAGTAYLVGEQGPEIIVPPHSGTVIPNHALGGGSGGTTVHMSLTINADGSDAQQSGGNNQLGQFAKLMEGKAREVIIQESRPGGLLWGK